MTHPDRVRAGAGAAEAELRQAVVDLGEQLLERDRELERLGAELRRTYETRIWRVAARYVVIRRRLGVLVRRVRRR